MEADVESFRAKVRFSSSNQQKSSALRRWNNLFRFWLLFSDIVVQIVDARNPLLYWSSDLATYVGELDPSKEKLILVNKADLLPEPQRCSLSIMNQRGDGFFWNFFPHFFCRQKWAEFFNEAGLKAVFFSAIEEEEEEVAGSEVLSFVPVVFLLLTLPQNTTNISGRRREHEAPRSRARSGRGRGCVDVRGKRCRRSGRDGW